MSHLLSCPVKVQCTAILWYKSLYTPPWVRACFGDQLKCKENQCNIILTCYQCWNSKQTTVTVLLSLWKICYTNLNTVNVTSNKTMFKNCKNAPKPKVANNVVTTTSQNAVRSVAEKCLNHKCNHGKRAAYLTHTHGI